MLRRQTKINYKLNFYPKRRKGETVHLLATIALFYIWQNTFWTFLLTLIVQIKQMSGNRDDFHTFQTAQDHPVPAQILLPKEMHKFSRNRRIGSTLLAVQIRRQARRHISMRININRTIAFTGAVILCDATTGDEREKRRLTWRKLRPTARRKNISSEPLEDGQLERKRRTRTSTDWQRRSR